MDIKAPVIIFDELDDEVLQTNGLLNLASGEVYVLEPINWGKGEPIPMEREDYDFTYGVLSAQGKDVEFEITAENGSYNVSADELVEIKTKLAKLLAATQEAEKKTAPKKAARPSKQK